MLRIRSIHISLEANMQAALQHMAGVDMDSTCWAGSDIHRSYKLSDGSTAYRQQASITLWDMAQWNTSFFQHSILNKARPAGRVRAKEAAWDAGPLQLRQTSTGLGSWFPSAWTCLSAVISVCPKVNAHKHCGRLLCSSVPCSSVHHGAAFTRTLCLVD